MAMRPKKVEKVPFFADSPIVSPGKTRSRPDSVTRPRPTTPSSPASVTKAKANPSDWRSAVRSPGFGARAKAKSKVDREKLVAQEARRSSIIQRDENIGMELMDAPGKRTSRSGEDDDFFAELDGTGFASAGYGFASGRSGNGALSSASETPTFAAQSPTEDEATQAVPQAAPHSTREPRSTTSRVTSARPSPAVQSSIFSSDEDSSPARPVVPQSRQKEPPRVQPQLAKRTSASFLSESEDSPVADSRRRFPAKFQELPGQRSEPAKRSSPVFQDTRATQSESVKFPPEDVTLTFEPMVTEEDKEPQRAPQESDSDAILSQDLEDLPLQEIPEGPDSPQVLSPLSPSRRNPPRDDVRSKSRIEVEPLPMLKVTPSPGTTDTSSSQAFSPVNKYGHRSKADLSSTSASTCTPSGESVRFMASPSAASELSRSPFNEDQSQLKQQLEELEEQQKQIQTGLKEALQHHRRLWADELTRCQEVSAELEKALEEERKQHAEQIKEWERRLQSELSKKESQWREEVDALVKEVERLRQRCREHMQRKPPPEKSTATVATSCDDQDLASMMDVLNQQLQPPSQADATTVSLPKRATQAEPSYEVTAASPKHVRIAEKAQVVETELTLPIGSAREARLEASSTAAVRKAEQLLRSRPEESTLPAPRQALVAGSPSRDMGLLQSPTSSPVGMEFPTPVLVLQEGKEASNSPLKRIKPKVQTFLDATPIGPPLPSFTPWSQEEINAMATHSRSPRGTLPAPEPSSPWSPSWQHAIAEREKAQFAQRSQASSLSAQVPMEPVAQAWGSPSARGRSPAVRSPDRSDAFEAAPKAWRRDGFEPSLM